ncbi:MAG: HD domain-containing protein [Steroidobacteraceae bacterium]
MLEIAVVTDSSRLILRAADFSAYKHRYQTRKGKDVTPYINHPLAVARALSEEGDVTDPELLAAALLHDTIEDTQTTFEELRGTFGERVAHLVVEVSDDKNLPKGERKRRQVEHATHISRDAQQIKIADKLCNLREILSNPPAGWSVARKQEYFEWAKAVVNQIREANRALAAKFDAVYAEENRAHGIKGQVT